MKNLIWNYTIDQINKMKLEPHSDELDDLLEEWFAANENPDNTTQEDIDVIEYEILNTCNLG